jgi:stress response protein YsnF
MTLEEIMEAGSGAAEQRVLRMTANAKSAQDRAKQLQDQADASADILKLRQTRLKATKARKASCGKMIKPYK